MNTLRSSSATCLAGASKADITPEIPVFLYGYPNCARMAEAVNDRLEANVLFIRTSGVELFLVSCDLAFVSARLARRVQGALAPARVLIGATHTHSGPVTVPYVLEFEDPYVPGPDADYLERLERKLVEACVAARASATPASLSHAVASSLGLGRHRHDPARPVDARMPVLACRDQGSGSLLAIWVICPMHPTVLHEDFRAVSGDFPGLGRHLLRNRFGDLPVVHWAGVCGDLSPRHVVQSNTLGEASRLGSVYAEEIRLAISRLTELDMTSVVTARAEVSLPLRDVPGESDAERQLEEARERLAQLRGLADASVSRARIRTAECDMFGAECRRALARARRAGLVPRAVAECMPAEVTLLKLGRVEITCLPGEWLTGHLPGLVPKDPTGREAYVATIINGELQGYIATEEAMVNGWYEAGSALFDGPLSAAIVARAVHQLRNEIGVSVS